MCEAVTSPQLLWDTREATRYTFRHLVSSRARASLLAADPSAKCNGGRLRLKGSPQWLSVWQPEALEAWTPPPPRP